MKVSESDFDNLLKQINQKAIYRNDGLLLNDNLYRSQEELIKAIQSELSFLMVPSLKENRLSALEEGDTEKARAISTLEILRTA